MIESAVQSITMCDIGITGNVHDEQIADFVSHGANGVVTKPLTKAKLLDAMAHYSPLQHGC